MKFTKDLLQGHDGQWNVGRLQSFPVLGTGLWVIIDTHLHNRTVPSMADLGIGLAGVAAATIALLTATKNINSPGTGLVEKVVGVLSPSPKP